MDINPGDALKSSSRHYAWVKVKRIEVRDGKVEFAFEVPIRGLENRASEVWDISHFDWELNDLDCYANQHGLKKVPGRDCWE